MVTGRLPVTKLGVKLAPGERREHHEEDDHCRSWRSAAHRHLAGGRRANAEIPPLPQAGEYSTCGEAAQDGVFNIPEGDENYWDEGDRDGDGIACEKN